MHRERAWRHLAHRYAEDYAAWRVTLAEAPEGPWCKAAAVNPAVARSEAEIIIVADADVWCDGLREAVEAVKDGAPWAIPHDRVYRLTEAATEAFFSGGDWRDQPLAQRDYQGVIGGGFVVATRDVLRAVPLDPRFTGWGNEDESWGVALQTLVGIQWRGEAPLIHCYHPPQERASRRWGSVESRALAKRYHRARNKPEQMRALIYEPSSADQPTRSDPHPV